MAKLYKTPGVYIEEIPKFPPSIAPVETAIPAFIGYTEKNEEKVADDLHLIPTRISSLLDYETQFGFAQEEQKIVVTIFATKDASGRTTDTKTIAEIDENARSKHIMYYALQLYFANGGGPCYIVSVEKYKPLDQDLIQSELLAGLNTLENVDEPTLIVFPEAQKLSANDFGPLHDAALKQCEKLQDRFVIMDAHGGDLSFSESTTKILKAIENFRGINIGITTDHLKYGAAYAPNIETILDYSIDESQIEIFRKVDDEDPASLGMLDSLKSADNALYEGAKSKIRDLPCKMPPSAAIAGIYAAVDNNRGVWKAPANVGVSNVIKPTIEYSNVEQDQMNVDVVAGKSVNAIRPFLGKGTLVWGARTLAGNDLEWRYINVRRTFIFVEESVKKATEQFVFEPNDANTWVRVQAMIENFLTTLWRQGALQGVKTEHAFYVAVGLGKTMTALDILEGRMIVEIGMAVVRPAEFIILRFSHKMAES
jgi:Bacteriophage tail sheath protein